MLRLAFGATFLIPIQSILLFVSAGTLRWAPAWLYTLVAYVSAVASMLVVGHFNPALADSEIRFPQEQQSWDRVLLRVSGVLMLGSFVVAGLDYRCGWSSGMGALWRWGGVAGLLGFTRVLATWSMCVNPHWSGAVVIQEGEGHQVCERGPYRLIRHPGYLAGVFQMLWPPLILGSWWAFLPSVMLAILIILRTHLEDRFLLAQLPGYADYSRRVRYRMLPGIW